MAAAGEVDPDVVDASKGYVTLVPGACVFDHVTSFTIVRGGHLTHAVIGAIEVAANGDLANWRMPGQKVPGVGGAMDIAFSVKNLFVAMTHVSNKGEPKIVARCSSPLTAPRSVRRIFTDIAVIDVEPEGLVLREVARGMEPTAIQAQTGAPLRVADDCREMDVPAEFAGVKLME